MSAAAEEPGRIERLRRRTGMTPRAFTLSVGLPVLCAAVIAASLLVAPASDRGRLVLETFVAMLAGASVSSVGVFGGVLVPGLLLAGADPLYVPPLSLMLQVLVIPLGAASHYRLGNVSQSIALPLVVGGTIGAAIGVFFVATIPAALVARLIAGVIVSVGVMVLLTLRLRGLGHVRDARDVPTGRVGLIGSLAGFPTAISGAGWGPVGMTLLILSRIDPRQAVGSSTFGRLFIALFSVAFYVLFGKSAALQSIASHWWLIPALWAGAIVAIVPGAFVVTRLGRARATLLVTGISILLSLPTLIGG